MARIMLADDDPAIAEAMKAALEEDGHDVLITADGQALNDIGEEFPELILLDIWMSGMNGRDIALELKNRAETNRIPVIMVSANRDCGEIAAEVGADDYLLKPFELDDLISKVRRFTR